MKQKISVLVGGVLLLVAVSVFSAVSSGSQDGLVAGARLAVEQFGQVAGSKECPPQPKREFAHASYYTGPLFDAHLHLPSSSSIVSSVSTKMGLPTPAWNSVLSYEYIACLLKAENTRGAFGFHLLTKYSLSSEVSAAKALDKKQSGISHFLMPAFVNPAVNPSVESVRKLVEKNPALFTGIGELKFFDGTSPDNPRVLPYYQLAEKNGLIVMMHPFDHHKDAVVAVVKQYPKVRFLLHSIDGEGRHPGDSGEHNNIGWVMELLRTYPNVYYSVDDAPIWGWKREHSGVEKPSKEEVMAHFRETFDSELDRLTGRWKDPIETYPDRILSGTDRWYGWHYERDASALIIEFKRAFIGRLAPSVQEKYAYRNAEGLLKKANP